MTSKTIFTMRSVACAVALSTSFGAHALDSFDAATGRLSMDSVSVGVTTYTNVVVTVNAFALQGVAGGTPSADSFDTSTNMLVLGAVAFQGTTYNNVRVRIDSYALTGSTFSDCASNAALLAVGSTAQTTMQGTDQSTTSTTTTVNRLTTFNGNSALEVQSDSSVLAGSSAGSTSSTKTYQQALSTSIATYGNVQNLFSPSQGSLTQSSTYSPAIQSPLSLSLNTPSTQTIAIAVTSPTAGSANATQVQTMTFLGMESVTVPIGTFMTCKIRADALLTVAPPSTQTVNVSTVIWRIASGPYRGLTVKTLNNLNGVQSVATKMAFNGS